jgi:type VI protein secretion system component Hcp
MARIFSPMFAALMLLSFLCGWAGNASAQVITLQVSGVPGGFTTVPGLTNALQVLSADFSVSNTPRGVSTGTAGAVNIQKYSDGGTTALFRQAATGGHAATATITFWKLVAGAYHVNVQLTLSNVAISSFSTAAAQGGSSVETMSLLYDDILVTNYALSSNGVWSAPLTHNWNLVTGVVN